MIFRSNSKIKSKVGQTNIVEKKTARSYSAGFTWTNSEIRFSKNKSWSIPDGITGNIFDGE